MFDSRMLSDNEKAEVSFGKSVLCPAGYGILGESFLLKVDGSIRKDGEKFIFEGEVSGSLEFSCSFCLSAVQRDFSTHEEIIFSKSPDSEAEEWAVIDGMIDLTPAASAYFFSVLPSAFLCEENCLGLCPICGNNKNHTPCKCKIEKSSPFDGLNGLDFQQE